MSRFLLFVTALLCLLALTTIVVASEIENENSMEMEMDRRHGHKKHRSRRVSRPLIEGHFATDYKRDALYAAADVVKTEPASAKLDAPLEDEWNGEVGGENRFAQEKALKSELRTLIQLTKKSRRIVRLLPKKQRRIRRVKSKLRKLHKKYAKEDALMKLQQQKALLRKISKQQAKIEERVESLKGTESRLAENIATHTETLRDIGVREKEIKQLQASTSGDASFVEMESERKGRKHRKHRKHRRHGGRKHRMSAPLIDGVLSSAPKREALTLHAEIIKTEPAVAKLDAPKEDLWNGEAENEDRFAYERKLKAELRSLRSLVRQSLVIKAALPAKERRIRKIKNKLSALRNDYAKEDIMMKYRQQRALSRQVRAQEQQLKAKNAALLKSQAGLFSKINEQKKKLKKKFGVSLVEVDSETETEMVDVPDSNLVEVEETMEVTDDGDKPEHPTYVLPYPPILPGHYTPLFNPYTNVNPLSTPFANYAQQPGAHPGVAAAAAAQAGALASVNGQIAGGAAGGYPYYPFAARNPIVANGLLGNGLIGNPVPFNGYAGWIHPQNLNSAAVGENDGDEFPQFVEVATESNEATDCNGCVYN